MMKNRDMVYHKLTHPQKRIWYIDKINPNSPVHNIGGCLSIYETIDVEVMKKTINLIIKNNEGLRLRVLEKDNKTFQYVKEFQNEDIDFLDFSNYENPQKEHETWANELFKKCFNLEESKLYYFAIYKISDNEYGILLNIHHIVSDGWSITLIQKQVCDIYRKLMNKEEVYIVNYSYLDVIKDEEKYLNSERFIKNKNFWKEKFSGAPEEFLYKTSNSLESNRQCFNIDDELSNKIKKFADDKKCSLNTFFIAILLIYINKATYKNDLVIGTPVFNRTNKEQKNMIGMFTSTVPVRFKLDTGLKIESLIKLVNRELKLCLLNQKYPYDLLIKDLELIKGGYDSLFKMCVNYYNSKYDNSIDDIDVELKEYYCGNQTYSLQLVVKEWEGSNITLNFDYKTSEYSYVEIVTMYEIMINIINQIVTDENIGVNDLKFMNQEEYNYKVYELNSTTSYYPQKTVCELFEEQVIKTPNKVALEFKEKTLTYKELNEKSNQLANHLREKGIGNKSIVAIMETHSLELVISILASMKVGAAYLPIDPSYPVERINYMLDDSKCNMLLTNFKILDVIKFQGNIINIKNINLDSYDKNNLLKNNDLNDLVYIIYTSGSTGNPKGVMVNHRGLTNYVCWAHKMYLNDENEVIPFYTSISFDLTITSMFTPLISGNQIIIYNSDEKDPVIYKVIRDNKATVVKLTPAHLALITYIPNIDFNVKRFIVGGEELKVSLAQEIYNKFKSNIEIYNEYGPTEATVGCMIYKYDELRDKGLSVPIGCAADNVEIYILDKYLNMVPTGIIGEIYISGYGLAKGYLNNEALTKEKFIENPFYKGTKMYKSGDLARWMEDGNIEFLGRADNQVKIRGYRIELEEIEARLLEHKDVKDAIVLAKNRNDNEKYLSAYVVCENEVSTLELKLYLKELLPEYMIPAHFIELKKMPLTSNGKIDKGVLPEPNLDENLGEYEAPQNKIQGTLSKIWSELLGQNKVGINDNFFELGGHSLNATRLVSKISKELNVEVQLKELFKAPTIKELSSIIIKKRKLFTVKL